VKLLDKSAKLLIKNQESVLRLGDSYQKSLIKYNEIQKSSTELKKKMDTMSVDIEDKLASVYEETKIPIDFSLFSSKKMIYGYQVKLNDSII
jgi:hypothetical protein